MADMKTSQHIEIVKIETFADAAMTIPAPVEGDKFEWASSDETVLKIVPDGSGSHGFIEAVAPGTARGTVTADADTGEGVETITGVTEDIIVTMDPAKAGFFKVTLAPATPKA